MRYEDMEFENYDNVLHYIINEPGNPTRAEIAKDLGLSKATVTQIISRFMAYGLISEGKLTEHQGKGRPGNPISIRKDVWFVLGASLSDTTWQFVISDLTGEIVQTYELPVPLMTPEYFLNTLVEGLRHMIGICPGKFIPGVGIGVPGVVDEEHGDIVFAYDYGWTHRVNIAERVMAEFGLPVFVMNRNNLAGIAEYRYANPDREQSMIYIGIGSGIRATIFSDGHVIRGADGRAGRISHVQVDPEGRLCSCGKRGCLFTVANETVLLEDVRNMLDNSDIPSALREDPSRCTVPDVILLAEQGDMIACEAVKHMALAISKAIRMVSVVLNPRLIVLGGPVGDSEVLVSVISDDLKENTGYQDILPEVRRCSIKPYGSARGAVSLVIDNALSLIHEDFINSVKQQ